MTETIETTTVEETVVDNSTSPETTAFTDGSGNFVPGWLDKLPEDIRGEKCLESVTGVEGLTKSYVHAQRMVGKAKMAIPGENTTEAEWGEIHDNLGRPSSGDEYGIEIPQEMSDYFPDARLQEARQVFYNAGFNQKQVETLIGFQQKMIAEDLAEVERTSTVAKQNAEETLRKKWGQAYDEKLHMANRMVADSADEAIKQPVIDAIGNNPVVLEFLANIAGKFMEHGVITDLTSTQQTPADTAAEINTLMQTDEYSNGLNPGHKAMVARVLKLHEKKAEAEGRTG